MEKNNTRTQVTLQLLQELAEGEKSAQEEGWLAPEEVWEKLGLYRTVNES